MKNEILREAKRLYDLGWAVHWIRPGSKAPVKSKWTTGARDNWAVVEREYQAGFGLGVRMGEASKTASGYLANIDVDIKSDKPKHRAEAIALLKSKFPDLSNAPVVRSSYGFRVFVATEAPLPSGKLGSSSEETVVFMPTAEINKRQIQAVEEGRLSREKLEKGYRVRPAWEVEFMSVGKQVVLPPSIHPDTKKPYIWHKPVTAERGLPVVSCDAGIRTRGRPAGSTTVQKFEAVEVDLMDARFSDRIADMIASGAGVEDRSAACFAVSIAMLRGGFSENEILSILTDRETYLGETAFDHRKTESRANAAAWVRDYCVAKAKEQISAARVFEEEAEIAPQFDTEEEAEAAAQELYADRDWRWGLARAGKNGEGAVKPTLDNTLLVLKNAISPRLFLRDDFAGREFYGCDAPWTGGEKGKALTDDDAVNIKAWLAKCYGFEPSINIVFEAMVVIGTENSFHPIRESFEKLPEWDGVDRLDTWLERHFNARGDKEYLAQVFRKWLVAAVARVMRPGTKFDWMPIFEGLQGTGKSSFGAILFGQKYFTDWLPELKDKDAALGLQGIHCVEFGELDSLRKNEVDTIKAFVTRQVDKVRPPFGRKTIEVHRQCVFYGTTNREEYLKDDTGNRRFNPVEVGQLDFEALRRERDQLWAEAVFIERNELEESLYLTGQAKVVSEKVQIEKLASDESTLMAEKLIDWLETDPDLEDETSISVRIDRARFRVSELFEGGGPLEKWKFDARNSQFAGKALGKLIHFGNLFRVEKRKIRGSTYYKAVKID